MCNKRFNKTPSAQITKIRMGVFVNVQTSLNIAFVFNDEMRQKVAELDRSNEVLLNHQNISETLFSNLLH